MKLQSHKSRRRIGFIDIILIVTTIAAIIGFTIMVITAPKVYTDSSSSSFDNDDYLDEYNPKINNVIREGR